MSEHYQTAIRALEQELEATQQRCHTIERAIDGLREISGDTPRARRIVKRNGAVGRVKPANGNSLADEDLDAVIIQLKKRTGQSPQELQAALKLTPTACRRRMKLLIKAKRVEVTGKTASRRFWLPGTAKEGL